MAKAKKMNTVKNACNRPLYLNLVRGRAVKIPARSTAEVEEADLQSPEMILHRNRSNVVVLEEPKEKVEHVEAESATNAKREVPAFEKAEPEKKAEPANKVK